MNSDGLYVKFGLEEGKSALGGEYSKDGNIHEYEVTINYTEVLSATAAIIDGGSAVGPFGVVIPEGLKITEVETFVATAFTSSGTIGSATLVMGLVKASDRSTELDLDGFTTSSFVGGAFDAVGETTLIRTGTTGAGAFLTAAATISENGVFVAANSAHASHPFTAGKLIVKIRGYYP
jgi:hypothetical protein